MSNPSRLLALTGVLLFLLCTASVASAAYADPPGRVARLNHTQGEVSYSPAGENEWVSVVRNRPLIRGDRLWTDRDARAEFQVGSTAIRLGSNTSVEILDLSDSVAQVQMTQGTLNLRVRRMYPGQIVEVDTPTLAFSINRAGRYRIDVDPHNDVTTIVVWEGAGEAYGENANFPLRAGDTVRFYDAGLRDYEMYGLPGEDDFDRYSLERDRRLDRSASLRYIDDDVVGYADLDEYGSWSPVRSYGTVWFPSRVDADWAPYRDGHWVWQEPWGWTWVDDAPWGFAPSHYGRWVYVSNRWGWIPGPRNVRPIYAPALVAFVGGHGLSVSLSLGGGSPIGWFPLGPREVYVPSYQASRDYFTRVNVNNTVINNTTITNVYNNYSSGTINVNQVNYANRTVAGAVTVVPSTVFVNAQPVRPAAIRIDRNAATTGQITRVAPIAPSVRSVIGTATAAGARPSREASDRRVFVRNVPPPGERPFAAREQQLQKNPGRALEPSAVKSVQSGDVNTAQKVRVIGEQRGAVDARAAGSSRGGNMPGARANVPGQLRPLDRSAETGNRSAPGTSDQSRGKEIKGQGDVQQQEQSKRKADSEKQAAEKQQAEKQQAEKQQAEKQQAEKQQAEKQQAEKQQAEKQQAEKQQAEKQQAEKQQAEKQQAEKQQAEKQQAERQRQVETQQQEQSKRKADSEKQAAEKQQAEKQQAEKQQAEKQQAEKQQAEKQQAEKQQAEKQQAEKQQAEKRQAEKRQAEKQQAEKQQAEKQQAEKQQAEKQQAEKQQAEKQQAEKQQAEKQQAEKQQAEKQQAEKQQAEKQQAEKQQAEKRQAEKQQAEKQQAEKRQAEKQQAEKQQAEKQQAEKQQAEKQQAEKQQAEKQQAEKQQAAKQQAAKQQAAKQQAAKQQAAKQQAAKQQAAKQQAERQRQAECERQAIEQHQDVSQCRSETLPQENPGNPKADKKSN